MKKVRQASLFKKAGGAFIKVSSEAPLLLIWLVYTCITRVAPSILVRRFFWYSTQIVLRPPSRRLKRFQQ